jgi:hypothetical protein
MLKLAIYLVLILFKKLIKKVSVKNSHKYEGGEEIKEVEDAANISKFSESRLEVATTPQVT